MVFTAFFLLLHPHNPDMYQQSSEVQTLVNRNIFMTTGINMWCKNIAGGNTNFKTRELNA